ncbi:MAG: hypothetical protein OXB88_02630 [Bacteriovoracales bacterium]|nr:hypothetical protein [Bacteriovoracales bacterium]
MESRSSLKSTLALHEFPVDTPLSYSLNEKVDWPKALLEELNEEVGSSERNGFSSAISIRLEALRRRGQALGDYLLLEGEVWAKYITRCIMSFEIMEEILTIPMNAVVIPRIRQRSMGLEEATIFFVDDRERDLFFYDLKVDVAEIVHEYIYLNKNPYPKKSSP